MIDPADKAETGNGRSFASSILLFGTRDDAAAQVPDAEQENCGRILTGADCMSGPKQKQ